MHLKKSCEVACLATVRDGEGRYNIIIEEYMGLKNNLLGTAGRIMADYVE